MLQKKFYVQYIIHITCFDVILKGGRGGYKASELSRCIYIF
jgi:hypothetical protein